MTAHRKSGIGLDISDGSICVVELGSGPKGLRLLRSGSAPTPPGSVLDGTIVQPKPVARAVKRLLRSLRLSAKGKRAVVSLPSSAVVARVTQLPVTGPRAIAQHLQQEIKRYAVFTGGATVSDFTLINPPPGREEGRPALLAVATEDTANALARTVVRAGLDPFAIDVSFLACARALYSQYLTPHPPSGVVLAVVESKSLDLVAVQGGTIRFSRTTPHTGDIFDEAASSVTALASEIRSILDFYGTHIGDPQEVQRVVICTSFPLLQSASRDSRSAHW
jgi:type IV pilus assembly protein PilM